MTTSNLSTPADPFRLTSLLSKLSSPSRSSRSTGDILETPNNSISYKDLTIVQCSPDQVLRIDELAWNRRRHIWSSMSLEEWLEISKRDRGEDVIVWGLVPREHIDTLDVRAYCQTHRRRAILHPPSISTSDQPGKVNSLKTSTETIPPAFTTESVGPVPLPEMVTAYGISKVYCPPEYRRNGYGRHLLQLLHYTLSPRCTMPSFPESHWGPPPAVKFRLGDGCFSYLYSGIWEGYYESCTRGLLDGGNTNGPVKGGWVKQKVVMRRWDLGEQSFQQSVSSFGSESGTGTDTVKRTEARILDSGPGRKEKKKDEGDEPDGEHWEWLDLDGIRSLEAVAAKHLLSTIRYRGDQTKTRLAILPDQGILSLQAFHALRNAYETDNRFNGLRLHRNRCPPPSLNDKDDIQLNQQPTFIIYNKPARSLATLQIIYASPSFPFGGVLRAARQEGCRYIERWSGISDDLWKGCSVNDGSHGSDLGRGSMVGFGYGYGFDPLHKNGDRKGEGEGDLENGLEGQGEDEVKESGVRPYLCFYGLDGGDGDRNDQVQTRGKQSEVEWVWNERLVNRQ